jgi:hypothetical protein
MWIARCADYSSGSRVLPKTSRTWALYTHSGHHLQKMKVAIKFVINYTQSSVV